MAGNRPAFLAVEAAELGLGKLYASTRDAVVVGDLEAHKIVPE